MAHSLQLNGAQIRDLYQKIKNKADMVSLKKAYLKFADNLNIPIAELNISRIDDNIDFIASRSSNPQHTCLLLNMLSYMVQMRMLPIDELRVIIKEVMNCSRDLNCIGIMEDGTWTIVWQVKSDDSSIFVQKLNPEFNEIVPESIIGILNSAFLCFAKESYLAALSLVLVALEATLWDHLFYTKSIGKIEKNIIYPNKVSANIRWDGSEYKLKIFDASGSEKVPLLTDDFDVDIYHTSQLKDSKRVLKIFINDSYSHLLSDSSNEQVKEKESAGLNKALQLARTNGLIEVWESHLDETFRILRNNLVHQSNDHNKIQINTLYGQVKLSEFSEEPQLALFFIKRVIEYISDAYYDCGLHHYESK